MYLVTGASGFIGQCLIKKLQDQGIKTRALIRPRLITGIDTYDYVDFFNGDLLKTETLIEATKDIDTVIHLAGVTHAFDKNLYAKVNIEGTNNLVFACRQNKVNKIVYISTRAISPLGGEYSISKAEGEQIIKSSEINFTILRLAEVYGGDSNKGIENLIKVIRKFFVIPIIGNGDYRLKPVYVKDVINAIISVSQSDKTDGQTYTIAGPDAFTYNELIKLICNYLCVKRCLVHMPVKAVLFAAYINSFFIKSSIIYPDQVSRLISPKDEDIGKAAEDFGYKPINFKNGLRLILSPR